MTTYILQCFNPLSEAWENITSHIDSTTVEFVSESSAKAIMSELLRLDKNAAKMRVMDSTGKICCAGSNYV